MLITIVCPHHEARAVPCHVSDDEQRMSNRNEETRGSWNRESVELRDFTLPDAAYIRNPRVGHPEEMFHR